MTDQERFLDRWSRKKREAAEASDAPENATDVPAPTPVAVVRQGESAESPASLPAASAQKFDISRLPSIDSITAETDIRAFFAPGVPPELTRAALRRAWSADPAIRDYIGLSENAWDFNAPDGALGFGELLPGVDTKKLAAQLLGEPDNRESEAAAENKAAATPSPQVTAMAQESTSPVQSAGVASSANTEDVSLPHGISAGPGASERDVQDQFVHREDNAASHNNNPNPESEKSRSHRRHGAALPK
jgi:hypothetical protein